MGSSSSSRQSTTVKDYVFNNVGAEGAAAATNLNLADSSIDGKVEIVHSDQGAIEAGRDIAVSAINEQGEAVEGVLEFAGENTEDVLDLGQDVVQRSSENTRLALQRSAQSVDEAVAKLTKNKESNTTKIVSQITHTGALIAGAGLLALLLTRS